jgi:NAD(P)-dependent dehydrogenase (short-subunit alcohol dehydrogenase family)
MNLQNRTLLRTPFGFHSTAQEVAEGIDLSGKRALVTGAASGIGIETARALARTGAQVTLAVRDLEAGKRVAAELAADTGNPGLQVVSLELTDRASIAALAAAWEGPLHILVNNAGVMACPETHTAEGWELQFATNHLGHFALALALHPALVQAQGARVVVVSSSAHHYSPVIFDDLHFAFRSYDPWAAYGQSKTANALFAVAAARRWAGDGIFANALMPGGIKTNLGRHLAPGSLVAPDAIWKTPQEGAATSVLLAVSPLLDGISGRYFADCNEARLIERRGADRFQDMDAVAPFALDPANAERLWETSVRLLA